MDNDMRKTQQALPVRFPEESRYTLQNIGTLFFTFYIIKKKALPLKYSLLVGR